MPTLPQDLHPPIVVGAVDGVDYETARFVLRDMLGDGLDATVARWTVTLARSRAGLTAAEALKLVADDLADPTRSTLVAYPGEFGGAYGIHDAIALAFMAYAAGRARVALASLPSTYAEAAADADAA